MNTNLNVADTTARQKVIYDLNGIAHNDGVVVKPEGHFEALPSELMFGVPITLALTTPYGRIGGGIKSMFNGSSFAEYWRTHKPAKADLSHLNDASKWQTIKNRNAYRKLNVFEGYVPKVEPLSTENVSQLTGKRLAKYNKRVARAFNYNGVKSAIEAAKGLSGQALKDQLKVIDLEFAKARLADHTARTTPGGALAPITRRGKALQWVKTKSGYNAIKGKVLTAATKETATGKFLRMAGKGLKGGKGNLLFAAIATVGELPNIFSAYSVDSKTGNKQLAKSGTKVATSVLGYAAGAAATGALLGSVVPGIGNVVGGILGFVGGCIGGAVASWGAEKLWDWKFGKGDFEKSETEMIAEENAEAMDKNATDEEIIDSTMQQLYEQKIIDENGQYIGTQDENDPSYIKYKNFMEYVQSLEQGATDETVQPSYIDYSTQQNNIQMSEQFPETFKLLQELGNTNFNRPASIWAR